MKIRKKAKKELPSDREYRSLLKTKGPEALPDRFKHRSAIRIALLVIFLALIFGYVVVWIVGRGDYYFLRY
jgi:hypothetical protein